MTNAKEVFKDGNGHMIVFHDIISERPFVAMIKELRPIYAFQMACGALVCVCFLWAVWRILSLRKSRGGLATCRGTPAGPAGYGLVAGIVSAIAGIFFLGPLDSSATHGPSSAVNAAMLPLYLGLIVASGGVLQHSIIAFLLVRREGRKK